MKRRPFVLGGIAWALAPLARAQPRKLKVACLASGSEALLENLRTRVEGGLAKEGLRDLELRIFSAASEEFGVVGRNATAAVAWVPDALLAAGPMHAIAARDATRTIPVVFFGVPDPVTLGLVQSLPRPGGNISGSATDAAALVLKRLELARELLPQARKVVGLHRRRPGGPMGLLEHIGRELARAGAGLGLQVELADVGERGLTATLAAIERLSPDAIVPFGPYEWEPMGRQADASAALREYERRTRTLVIHEHAQVVRQGAAVAMYPGGSQLGAGIGMLAKVLKGAVPRDLPVQLPLEHFIAVNRGAARAIGLQLPPAVMIRADVVVD